MSTLSGSFTVVKLYRDCLRLADHASLKNPGSRLALREQVRVAFRKNASLEDPKEIEAAKEAAVRGLSNYMIIEANRMAQEEASNKSTDPYDG